jgi:hypothetical protein
MISFTWSELFLCFIGAEDVQLEKGEDRENTGQKSIMFLEFQRGLKLVSGKKTLILLALMLLKIIKTAKRMMLQL